MTLLSRSMALLLAGLIGLPMCWCCTGMAKPVTVQTSAAQMEKAAASSACCHATAEHEESQPSQAPDARHSQDSGPRDCPCESSLMNRDMVSRDIVLPAPDVTPTPLPDWQSLPLFITPAMTLASVRDALPALSIATADPPLYAWHCALLL